MDPCDSPELDDPRVIRASQEYLAELESGREPDREVYFQRAPECRKALSELFDGIALAHSMQVRPAVPGPSLAEPLGDFRILNELGRGGMGVVYEAIQLSLGRRVALKVLPFAAAVDARQRQRFQIEAQAAALLHHTNIVPVYAVGCERGLHFYAMQLIEGGSLADLIRAKKAEIDSNSNRIEVTTVNAALNSTRDLSGSVRSASGSDGRRTAPSRPLSGRAGLRHLVELMAKVADALEYAHQAGTIHRDIKPANLLLDHAGNIWITDFGLAHVNGDLGLTTTGDVLGTMRYMSPEQASGQRVVLDGRTDIYSLGATLYELLTLQHMFGSTAKTALLNSILNEDPMPLRHWDRSIPVEVETIVHKCLAKLPSERYSTAAALADDLRRFLAERPILAKRPTVIDTTRKWLRRHPSAVTAGISILSMGVVALGITTALVTDSLSREKERALEAEARFQIARRAADEMVSIAQNELSNAPFQDMPRRRLLEGALRYYQEFLKTGGSVKTTQAELQETHDRIERILGDLEVLDAGRDNFLLREPGVLDDLKATPDQRQRISEICTELISRQIAIANLIIDLDQNVNEEFVRQTREYNAAFSSTLTPGQMARLRQISLQWEGGRAFSDYRVIAALKLTPEQLERIRRLERRWVMQFASPRAMGLPSAALKPPSAQIFQSAVEHMLKELTTEQRQKWAELIGEPYKGPLGPPLGMQAMPVRPD